MICDRNLKIWSRCQISDYKKKFQKSRNEKRKGFAISKLCNLFAGGKKNFGKTLKQNIILYYCTVSYDFQKQVWNKWQKLLYR